MDGSKGDGFVRPRDVSDPLTPPPGFNVIGQEYVRQIVDLSPGQRKRYLGQLKVLSETPVRGSQVFAGPVTAIDEAKLKMWLIEWDRSLKTKANYHGLIHGVFAYAVKRGDLTANPAQDTAPDLDRRTVRVNKAWKRDGEDDTTETPRCLARQIQPKHRMRDHHLGSPKTPRSRRTITVAATIAELLRKRIEGRAPDDFLFISRSGDPLHSGDFYTHVWKKLMKAAAAEGIPRSGSTTSGTPTSHG